MAPLTNKLSELLEQAVDTPELAMSQDHDLLGSLVRAGARVSADEVRSWLGVAGATDEELIEVVRARVSWCAAGEADSGCSCACEYPDSISG